MKEKIIAFLFFIFGIVLFLFIRDSYPLNSFDNKSDFKVSFYEKMNFFENFEFFGIFIFNLIVGFLLSFIGYFTGGFLTLLILFWNGFLIAMILNLAVYKLSIGTILYVSKHMPLEIYAFLLFAEFGLRGRFFIKKILIDNEVDFSLVPKTKKLLYPTILLVFASFLEVI